MNTLNFVSVLPEAIVLGAVCLILVLDAFLPDRLRHWSFWLTQITLGAAAWSIFATAWREPVQAMNGMNPLGRAKGEYRSAQREGPPMNAPHNSHDRAYPCRGNRRA